MAVLKALNWESLHYNRYSFFPRGGQTPLPTSMGGHGRIGFPWIRRCSKLCRCMLHMQAVKRAHTRTFGAHTRKLGVHVNVPARTVLHIFHTRRSKYRWVLVKCCTKEILCEHRLWKINGNIGLVPSITGICRSTNKIGLLCICCQRVILLGLSVCFSLSHLIGDNNIISNCRWI